MQYVSRFEDNDGTIDLKEIPDKLYNVVICGQYDLIADIFHLFTTLLKKCGILS